MQSQVVAGSTVEPNPGFYPLVVRSSIPELPTPPNDIFSVQIALPAAVPGGVAGLFVPTLVHHPRQVNNLMAGGTGDLGFSTDGGANYAAGGVPGIAGDDVTALCYGPGATAAASDWWIGTSNGAVLRGDGGALAKVWTNVTPPVPAPGLGGIIITAVAVHPTNNNYVVAATGGNAGAIAQGRVFLTNNRGANWMEVTGLAVASVIGGAPPGAVAGPLNALPPCPVTSLAFDPTVAAASPQILYVGTLAGVYVIRNLPRLPVGPPPPIVPPAAFNPDWRTFNGPAAAPLPITLVNDLEIVSLAPRPGAVANSPESTLRLRLYAAMYGRGIFVCDVSPNYPPGVPQGGPPRRLVIRQHLIEDGLAYPRPTPTVLNAAPAAPNYNQPQMQGDPRLLAIPSPVPAAPPIGAFNDHSALDIRVDNEPFQYFDETLDGVEFDEDLRTKNVVTGQVNAVYVQIHNAGWDRFTQPVDVHLFFAPGAAPAAGADPAPLPDLHDNFWSNFTVEPELPAPAGPLAAGAARWQRIGKKRTIPANRLSAAYPAVVRFEWTPPVSLAAAGFVGLLAVCTNPEDPLGAPAAMPLVMRTLVRQERRAAFRLVAVNPYTPDVFIRDSVEDTGRATSGSFAGRSPDIIVVQSAEVNPAAAFADLLDTHNGDRIRTGSPQIIYVRVFNRRDVQVQADVEVLWTKPNAATDRSRRARAVLRRLQVDARDADRHRVDRACRRAAGPSPPSPGSRPTCPRPIPRPARSTPSGSSRWSRRRRACRTARRRRCECAMPPASGNSSAARPTPITPPSAPCPTSWPRSRSIRQGAWTIWGLPDLRCTTPGTRRSRGSSIARSRNWTGYWGLGKASCTTPPRRRRPPRRPG